MHDQSSKNRVCSHCGKTFLVKIPSQQQRFCSRRCMGAAKKRPDKLCAKCRKQFWPKTPERLFCSRACAGLGEPRPLLERFWDYVEKTPTCWLWTGCTDRHGYGRIYRGKHKYASVHRLSWEIHNGPIPDGQCVCHNCPGGDNPLCVNPAHFFLGSKADNNADAKAKGQYASGVRHGTHTHPESLHHGEEHHLSKLTETAVRDIRRRWDGTVVTADSLAAEYSVSRTTVYSVATRRTWKHVQ
jgi:endogenous inhibitor of DNA gyrase (YacG/DUF329 family)